MLTKEGRKYLLDRIINRANHGGPMYVRLAKADPSPADEDLVFSDLTECDWEGYTAVDVATYCGAIGLNGSDQGEVVSATITFTCSGLTNVPQTIYAVYLTQQESGGTERIVFMFRLATPVVINSSGDTFSRVIDFLDDNLI